MSHFKLITLVVFAVVMAGCSQKTIPDPDPTDATYGADESMGTSTSGMDGADPYGGESFGADPTAGELTMVIYFDFDSSEVRPEDQDLVARHAMQAGNNPGTRVRLEGHADERGSREYNIGLGERRSQAVRNVLLAHGVSGAQLSTVSYGEERPAAAGGDEQSYAMNRRVEISYVN